jgi:hypothetical protein
MSLAGHHTGPEGRLAPAKAALRAPAGLRLSGGGRQQGDAHMPSELARRLKIVIQGDNRVVKTCPNVFDHPNHAQRHPADTETRENVQSDAVRNLNANRFGEDCHSGTCSDQASAFWAIATVSFEGEE